MKALCISPFLPFSAVVVALSRQTGFECRLKGLRILLLCTCTPILSRSVGQLIVLADYFYPIKGKEGTLSLSSRGASFGDWTRERGEGYVE